METQKDENYCKDNSGVFYIPFESIEKDMMVHYVNGDLNFTVEIPDNAKQPHKSLYKLAKRHGHMTDIDIFSFLNKHNKDQVNSFKDKLIEFLT